MATTIREQQITTVEVSQAELNTLLVDKAKQAGFIDFDPTNVSVVSSDPATGSYHIIFERSVTP